MSTSANTFESFKLNKQILQALDESGFTQPTAIQQKAIPLLLAGHDLIGIAQTGTGKTAAYALPILMKVKYAQGMDPRALILTPTRELAQQVLEQFQRFGKYTDLRIVGLYGGSSIKIQREALEPGVDILVATPGRFMDLYQEQRFGAKSIKTLVLDEADRLMDMGFMPQIKKVQELMPRKRQNMLFSATMPQKVERLAEEFLDFPERLEIAPQASISQTIDHWHYKVPNLKTKIHLLQYLLEQKAFNKAIIFTKTKANANNLFKFITRKISDQARVIHGNKDQNARINAMKDFSAGEIKYLVATDVVARGIDIQDVGLVINFDVPMQYEDYVHRIGRTGRHHASGEAVTFINAAEEYHLQRIEEIIQQSIREETLPASVEITPTPREEAQEIARQLDFQRRKEDPDFKGAFHDKKQKPGSKKGNKQRRSKR